jgi:NTE family protein
MNKQKIAIACQGGGSQTAFTAGVLKTLFDNDIHHEKEIVALTGTSGGALNAALAWYGLLKTAKGDTTPIGKRITDFWEDLAASHPLEVFFDKTVTDSIRKVSEGLLPMLEISPYSSMSQWMQSTLSKFLPRERFTNFKGMLEDHIQFGEVDSLIEPDSSVLLIGAANVIKGNLKIFNSRSGEFRVEAILASAAIPSIFPAVQIGEDFYWDGLFSDNPPVDELMQQRFMGIGNFPDEIWIILINPIACKTVPTKSSEIVDRRNQMIGNVSLLQDLQTLELLGKIFAHRGFTEELLKTLGYTNPDWVKVRFIQISEEVQDSLDYPSKLSRNLDLIHKLMGDGEKQAREFLASLSKPSHTVEEAANELRGDS